MASSPTENDDLQFEQAEYTAPVASAITCKKCGKTIINQYYDVNGAITCSNCRAQIGRKRVFSEKLGSFTKAAVLGSIAAFGGFLLYFSVAKITGLEIGLISILVGILVGNTVMNSSGGKGGKVYQFLAVFLTYSAISASYSMLILPQILAIVQDAQADGDNNLLDEADADLPQRGKIGAEGAPIPPPADNAKLAEIKAKLNAKARKARAEADPLKLNRGRIDQMDPLRFAILLGVQTVVVLVSLYAFPIIAGFSSPIGFLIIGFALWEAWKINRKVVYVIQGPLALATHPSLAPSRIEAPRPSPSPADSRLKNEAVDDE